MTKDHKLRCPAYTQSCKKCNGKDRLENFAAIVLKINQTHIPTTE